MILNIRRFYSLALLFVVVLFSSFKSLQPAEFPGGIKAWKLYLLRNANLAILSQNQAPSGTYAVSIRFDINTDGSISNILAETKPGFGTEDEAVRLISKAPKWQPAKKDAQAGTQVKQIIRFTVTQEKSAYVEVDSIIVK